MVPKHSRAVCTIFAIVIVYYTTNARLVAPHGLIVLINRLFLPMLHLAKHALNLRNGVATRRRSSYWLRIEDASGKSVVI